MKNRQLMPEGENLQFQGDTTPKPEGDQRGHCRHGRINHPARMRRWWTSGSSADWQAIRGSPIRAAKHSSRLFARPIAARVRAGR